MLEDEPRISQVNTRVSGQHFIIIWQAWGPRRALKGLGNMFSMERETWFTQYTHTYTHSIALTAFSDTEEGQNKHLSKEKDPSLPTDAGWQCLEKHPEIRRISNFSFFSLSSPLHSLTLSSPPYLLSLLFLFSLFFPPQSTLWELYRVPGIKIGLARWVPHLLYYLSGPKLKIKLKQADFN